MLSPDTVAILSQRSVPILDELLTSAPGELLRLVGELRSSGSDVSPRYVAAAQALRSGRFRGPRASRIRPTTSRLTAACEIHPDFAQVSVGVGSYVLYNS